MRVLMVANHHRIVGGAETVAWQTADLLAERGHDVIPFAVREPEADASPWQRYHPPPAGVGHGPLRNAIETIYWPPAGRSLGRLIADARPDVAHVHHIGERLTVSVLDALSMAGVPTVMTLHDYWPVCPNYRLYRDGAVCTECLDGGRTWRVAWHGCLEGSRWRSVAAAAGAARSVVRGTWREVRRFVAPSRFLRDTVVAGGVAADTVAVLPNPVEAAEVPSEVRPAAPDDLPVFVYTGRLVAEKGLDVLLSAAADVDADVRIRVVGGGREEAAARRRTSELGLRVDFVGRVEHHDVAGHVKTATATVVPSRWFENCPMAILEAAALGVPSIASAIGGIPEVVADGVTGLLIPPGDETALAGAMAALARDRAAARSMGVAAWRRVRERHDPGDHVSALLRLYTDVA